MLLSLSSQTKIFETKFFVCSYIMSGSGSEIAMIKHKMRRVYNYNVRNNVNQLQVKKQGQSFNSSFITTFNKCIAINKQFIKPTEIIVVPEDKIFINFEDYTLGPISNSTGGTIQGGWSGGSQPYFQNDSTDDEQIVNTLSYSSPNSWCINSSLYGNPGTGSPFTPALNIETNSGDETSFNTDIRGKTFNYSFWFYGENTGVGSTTKIYNGSYQGNDRTGLNINIWKEGGGIRVSTYSYDTGSGNFPETNLATNLAYDTWHNIGVQVTYAADGNPNNDVFIYTINNGIPQTVLSWVNVWRQANTLPLSYGTRLAFATSSNPEGIYFDDILIELDTTSQTSSLFTQQNNTNIHAIHQSVI